MFIDKKVLFKYLDSSEGSSDLDTQNLGFNNEEIGRNRRCEALSTTQLGQLS